jgi:Uma2 family endonuclease
MTDQMEKQPFWEEMGLPAPGARIALEEYEALPETGFPIEWHDGLVIYPHWNEETMSPAPTLRHQYIVMRIIKLLLGTVPGGDVFTAPTAVRLSQQTVQPDVFWIADDSACVPQETHFLGGPDLIVEVLSPGNTENDRMTKYDLYERHGVGEYWIVDPVEAYIEVYTLADGRFRRAGAFKAGQVFQSPALGKAIPAASIFKG